DSRTGAERSAPVMLALPGSTPAATVAPVPRPSRPAGAWTARPPTEEASGRRREMKLARAVVFRSYGGPDVLELVEVPEPTAGENEVRVRVRAAGVNPVDCKIRQGAFATAAADHFPQTLGNEFAGIVDQVGAGLAGAGQVGGDQVDADQADQPGTAASASRSATRCSASPPPPPTRST